KSNRQRSRRDVDPGGDRHRSVVWRILDHVERHVSKIPLVGHAISTAKARAAVSKHVPRKPQTRRKVVWIHLPQLADRTVLLKQDLLVLYPFENRRTLPKIKVRVKRLIRVVLSPVVLVAKPEIQRETRANLPRVVEVRRPFVVPVASAEIRLGQRRL